MAGESTRPTFTIEPDRTGSGWHVRVAHPSYGPERIVGDFTSKADAQAWVDDDSQEWLASLEASDK